MHAWKLCTPGAHTCVSKTPVARIREKGKVKVCKAFEDESDDDSGESEDTRPSDLRTQTTRSKNTVDEEER